MKILVMRIIRNKIVAWATRIVADLVEGDMIFSEAKENRLIKQLQQRLENAKMRLYDH